MKKINFDITQFILPNYFSIPTGIGRVELAYAQYLLKRHRDDTNFIITHPFSAHVVPHELVEEYVDATVDGWRSVSFHSDSGSIQEISKFLRWTGANWKEVPRHIPTSTTARQLCAVRAVGKSVLSSLNPIKTLSRPMAQSKPNIYLTVSGWRLPMPWVARRLGKSVLTKGIFLLHDIIPITHPGFVRRQSVTKHRQYLERLSACASVVVANSQMTADCFTRYLNSRGLRLPEVVCGPLGVDTFFIAKRERLNCGDKKPPPYFLCLGTIDPRKNQAFLLHIWRRLIETHGAETPKLIFVGKRGWAGKEILHELDHDPIFKDHVIQCGQVGDEVLKDLMAGCQALLFPSHVEGFGLPLAEALASGVPVICSDIDCFREVGGNIPEFVSPLDSTRWLNAIVSYSKENSEERTAQLHRLTRHTVRSWDDHFRVFEQEMSRLL